MVVPAHGVELLAAAVLLIAAGAEVLHARRVRRVAQLAFGPRAKPEPWARAAPLLRVLAVTGLVWGLTTLGLSAPKVHKGEQLAESDYKHVVLVLDVSPSMRLQDAGPDAQQSRMQRAHDVMESFFRRVAIQQYKLSVVAFYNGAKPVVIDTTDVEVVRNVLSDLPMHFAFPTGKTDVFKGLEEAARIAKPWKPRSTTVILVSDGDTVPASGMPKMPASVANVLVVGVGDPISGKFIEGHQSRQDASTLRQIATRLRGAYHDGNQNQLPTGLLRQLTETSGESPLEKLTRREYALIAMAAGATLYALLPLLLVLVGTRWRPGVPTGRGTAAGRRPRAIRKLSAVGR